MLGPVDGNEDGSKEKDGGWVSTLGTLVGATLGPADGFTLGQTDGSLLGPEVGSTKGSLTDGSELGKVVGIREGKSEGNTEISFVGEEEGMEEISSMIPKYAAISSSFRDVTVLSVAETAPVVKASSAVDISSVK